MTKLVRSIFSFVSVVIMLMVYTGVTLLLYRLGHHLITMIILVLLLMFFPIWAFVARSKTFEIAKDDLRYFIIWGFGNTGIFIIAAFYSRITAYCLLPILLFANYMAMYEHLRIARNKDDE